MKILLSPGYGAGWSTWNEEYPECLYHCKIIALVEQGASTSDIEEAATALWPDGYWGGAEDLTIIEVEDGILLKLNEYDGSESVEIVSCDSGYILSDSSLNKAFPPAQSQLEGAE